MAFDRKEYMREWMRKWREHNPEQEKARKKKYYAANGDKARAAQKNYYAANPEKVKKRERNRQRARSKRREQSAGRPKPDNCEICHRATKLNWDHCHATGKFRGWICFRCNAVLGLVEDSQEILSRLGSYLNAVEVKEAASVGELSSRPQGSR